MLRERKREKEKESKEKHPCERQTSICCLLPGPRMGIEPATQTCALTRKRTHDLLVYRTMLYPTEPNGQGKI